MTATKVRSQPPRKDAAPRVPGTPMRTIERMLFAAPVIGFAIAAWAHRQLYEDAFIYLRVVRHLRVGNGPVFNRGERVEAFTGPVWTFLLAFADLVTPVRLEWLAVLLGIACGAAGLTLAMTGARRLWVGTGSEAFFLPLGALAFVAVLPVWIFTSSGLEVGLVFLWLGASLWILATWALTPRAGLSIPRAVVLGLGWLVRPELVLFSALFFVLVLGADRRLRSRRALVLTAIAMLALPVAYQVWRMGYYGSIVPNTGIAKEGSSTNWSRGSRYFRDFAGPYLLWLPLLALLIGGYLPFAALARRWTRVAGVAGVFFAGSIAAALYVVAVGGDYLHARLLLPAFFAFCTPVAAIPLTRRHLVALAVAPWALISMVWFKPDQYDGNFVAHGFVISPPSGYHIVTLDHAGWGDNGPLRAWYRGPAFYLETGVVRYEVVDVPVKRDLDLPAGAFYGVGVSGYALGSDFHVLDLVGLGDSFTAHLETSPHLDDVFAGHEKRLPPPWLAARVTRADARPDASDVPSYFRPMIPPTTGTEFAEQVAWARAALKCDDIARVNAAAEAPLTVRRFASNFLHAFSNSRVRIPPDPEEAYRKFCGSDVPPEVRAVRSG